VSKESSHSLSSRVTEIFSGSDCFRIGKGPKTSDNFSSTRNNPSGVYLLVALFWESGISPGIQVHRKETFVFVISDRVEKDENLL